MFKSYKKILIFLFVIAITFFIGNTVLAQLNTGINQVAGIGLGNNDPRIIAANVIRVFLGFLGLIALLLVLYAGFLWTTSAGDASKIDKAKKILVSAVIGLLIILSAFAIASFILSKLLGATTAVIPGPPGPPGPLPGPGPTATGVSCDGNTLTPACDPDNTLCATGTEFCEPLSCTCQLLGGVGDPCDLDTTNFTCEPDDTLCQAGLACDGSTCLCEGAPIIDWISPVDNLGTPNGAVGDFMTIGGRFFGTTTGQVYFSDASGNPTILAQFPSSVNSNCVDNWTDWQIIVVVPAGTNDGPIRIVRQTDLKEDVTNNTRGPSIDDFLINTINRPGLCLSNPAFGYYEDSFTLQGVSFSGATQEVSFGNMISSTSAININTWTNTSVNADVPNITGGTNTIFVTSDAKVSNAISFNVYININNNPIIDHIDPNPGPPGQYATIFGNNFGHSYLSPAQVLFTHQVSGTTYSADGLDFPLQCQDSWWQNNYILIKIPPQIASDGNFGLYDVVVKNNSGFSSLPEVFDVNNAPPGPGICKMIPHNGPVGQNVEIIGDNFTSTIGTISFQSSVAALSSSWTNQSIKTIVPSGAITGPVNVTTSIPSNSFPFMVGSCDSTILPSDPLFQCGSTEECCDSTTYWDGVCRNIGQCNSGASITTSGYGWTFTSSGTAPIVPTSGACPTPPSGCRVEDGVDNTTVSASEQASSDAACVCASGPNVCYIDPTSLPAGTGVCVVAPPIPPGTPCNDGAACVAGVTACATGQFCDSASSCTCQNIPIIPGTPGQFCVDPVFAPTCTPSSSCGTDYSCQTDPLDSSAYATCGRCCCNADPVSPDVNIAGLVCVENVTPCSSSGAPSFRGLFCGCENDLQCGSPSTNACGNDTCCRERPEVVSTSPPDEPDAGSNNVCRNVLLEATFNAEMDTSTFKGNIILLGDYGNNPCPSGTQYLTLNKDNEAFEEDSLNKNNLVKLFSNFKNKINSLVFDEANAYSPVTATNNFCAIKGKTDGYNNVSGKGVLTFAPNRALDGNIRHYAIVIGDDILTDDNPRGVLDNFGISMGAISTYPIETFNSKDYKNSYIWSFVTMPDQGENKGLCTLDYVDVNPASYLFQTTENSLVEDDTNPLANSFDTEKDADKLFVATAKTISGQSLNPVAGLYSWLWSWIIDNTSIADETGVFAGVGNKRLIRAKNTATEGSTVARATALVTSSVPSIPAVNRTGNANIYLFLCNNPWPPISTTPPTTGQWSPWQDQDNNCDFLPEGAGTCANTNYEFYYCRDQGEQSTFDDLPPILNNAIIRGKDTGQDLFKEYYFFREATPDLSTTALSIASVPSIGGSVNISWDAFTASGAEVLDGFIVHYGTNSGNYTNTISIPAGTYTANISGLTNGQTYYFAVTAVYVSTAESAFTNEVSAIPVDTQKPAPSIINNAAIGNAQAEIEWGTSTDAFSYKLYWKAGSSCAASAPPDCYANSKNVGNASAAVIKDLTNGTTYYFAVTVIDSSGNESIYSNEVVVIPAVTSATVISGATQVALGWISANVTSLDEIYYIDMGIVFGIFEEFKEADGNRINLFGNIIKYIFKKITYSLLASQDAQAQVAEILIPQCALSTTDICREQIIEANGKHNTVIKNLSNGRKYRFIIKNGSINNQKVVDDIIVEMRDPLATEILFGEKCYPGSVCEGSLTCQTSGGNALIDQSACCNNDQCVGVLWKDISKTVYRVECIPDGITSQTLELTGATIAQTCQKGDWVTPVSN